MLVETSGKGDDLKQDTVDLLETNVDDVSGEVIAHAPQCTLEEVEATVAAAKAAQIRQMSVTEKNVTGAQMEIVRVIGS